jgi:membrane protein
MKAPLLQKIEKMVLFFLSFSKRITEDRVNVYAAQAAFFIVISSVPFLMMVTSLLHYVMPLSQEQMLELGREVLPIALRSYAEQIIRELYTQTSIPLLSVTAISILWAASKSIYALMQGLNEIYHSKETRNGVELRLGALVNTLLLMAILIASLLLLVFGRQLHALLKEALPAVSGILNSLYLFRSLWCVLLMILVFSLMYKVLPNIRTGFWDQLPGALFTTVIWLLYSFFYAFYIDHFSNFSFTYGSLAAIVFMMLWLYSCMKIILIGGEINMYLAERR